MHCCNSCNKKIGGSQSYGSEEKPLCRKCHEDAFRKELNEKRKLLKASC